MAKFLKAPWRAGWPWDTRPVSWQNALFCQFFKGNWESRGDPGTPARRRCLSRRVSQGHPAGVLRIFLSLCALVFSDSSAFRDTQSASPWWGFCKRVLPAMISWKHALSAVGANDTRSVWRSVFQGFVWQSTREAKQWSNETFTRIHRLHCFLNPSLHHHTNPLEVCLQFLRGKLKLLRGFWAAILFISCDAYQKSPKSNPWMARRFATRIGAVCANWFAEINYFHNVRAIAQIASNLQSQFSMSRNTIRAKKGVQSRDTQAISFADLLALFSALLRVSASARAQNGRVWEFQSL